MKALQPRMSLMHLCRTAALALVLASVPVCVGAGGMDQDTRLGLAHFALASGQPAQALYWTGDMTGARADYLRARAMLETGRKQGARDLLTSVAAGDFHRAEARLLLGRFAAGQQQLAAAAEHFQWVARQGNGDVRQQALYELAELERQAGKPDRAGQLLAKMEPGYWSALGYLNLAADYSQRDRGPARALVSLRVALVMSGDDPDSERAKDLLARIRLKAGYLSFVNEEYDKAIGFLEKVPLDSYVTPQALYYHGLAHAERNNHRAAMQSWHRARKYPLAYPGAADAWLGMGRGYDLAGYLGQAGEAYLAANAAYEGERVTLRTLASQIREKGAYHAIVRSARQSDVEWFLADNRMLTQPRMAYLLRFLEQADAQEAVNRVARQDNMAATLAEQEQSLAVFLDSLQDRLGTLGQGSGADRQQAVTVELEMLAERLDALRGRAVTDAEKEQLSSIGQTLGDIKAGAGSLQSRANRNKARLENMQDRVIAARARVREASKKLARLRGRSEAALDQVALAYIAREDERMVHALDRTEQQIAHLYEHLALSNLERGEP